MNTDPEITKEIFKRLKKLEEVVFLDKKRQKVTTPKSQNNFTGIKGGILLLIENGFFKTPHTAPEVKASMEENDYHYSIQAVQTALKRLADSRGPLTSMKVGKSKVYAERK